MYTEDINTGEMDLVVATGIGDTPHGHYYEVLYSEDRSSNRSGKVEMGRPVGLWSYFDVSGDLVKTYMIGRFGWPDGESIEYHPNGNIQWRGAYSAKRYSELTCPHCMPESPDFGKRVERWMTVPVGEWKQFDDTGRLIQTVTYSWVEE